MEIKIISLRNLNDEILSANGLTHVVSSAERGCCSDSRIRMIRCAAFFAVLIFSFQLPCGLWAQRKNSDAKISLTNYVRSATGQRESVSDANIRIRYAFNPEDINDKSTWIDEGQLKIAPDMTDYSSLFVEVNEDSLAHWFGTHGRAVAYPPARWIQGYRPAYWIEYQYSQITTKDGVLTEWATMPRELDTENLFYTENLPLFNWQIGTENGNSVRLRMYQGYLPLAWA